MTIKAKTYVVEPNQKNQVEVEGFLRGLRDEDLIEARASTLHGKLAALFVYKESFPKVLSTVPQDGATGFVLASSPANTEVWVTFDEKLDSTTLVASSVVVKENSTEVATTVTTSDSKYTLIIKTAFDAAAAYYSVMLLPSIPFVSGRTLGQDYIFSFKTA